MTGRPERAAFFRLGVMIFPGTKSCNVGHGLSVRSATSQNVHIAIKACKSADLKTVFGCELLEPFREDLV
jgi:hypothetical protein